MSILPTIFKGNSTGDGLAVQAQAKAQESIDKNKKNNPVQTKNASVTQQQKHSLLYGVYADLVKSLWKILTGVFSVEIVKGCLKDKNFDLAKVIDQTLRTDFLISSSAYLFGAWSIRLFNGENKILGIPIPKLPSAIAGHGASNIIAKIIGLITNTEILNKESAQEAKSSVAVSASKSVKDLPWIKNLEKVNSFYQKHISGKLTKAFSTLFGVSRVKDENGELKAKVNWLHFLSTIGLVGLGTWQLPKDTQVYGMEDLSKSQGFNSTLMNAALYVGASTLSRLDCYAFYNILALHNEGYGFKECMNIAIKDKMFPPLLQNSFDVVAGLINRFVPVNGAMLASLVTFPIDLVGAFLSADQIGLAHATRVPEAWTYISNKIWRPLSEVLETLLEPLFSLTVKPVIYQGIFGLFPRYLEGKYEQPKERILPQDIEQKFKDKNFFLLLCKSLIELPSTLVSLFMESYQANKKPQDLNLAL